MSVKSELQLSPLKQNKMVIRKKWTASNKRHGFPTTNEWKCFRQSELQRFPLPPRGYPKSGVIGVIGVISEGFGVIGFGIGWDYDDLRDF